MEIYPIEKRKCRICEKILSECKCPHRLENKKWLEKILENCKDK